MQTTAEPKPPETAEQIEQADQKPRFQVKVTQRNAITLPAELRRELHIEAGDTVELESDGNQLILRRPRSDAVARLRGILSPYFKDREEIQRFIDEERQGWVEREARLDEIWEKAERARNQSAT